MNQVLPIVSNEIDNGTEKVFTLNDVSFTMKLVEGGTFSMGCSSKEDKNRDSWDMEWVEAKEEAKPVHNVRVETFYLGETVVTSNLWEMVMGPGHQSYWKNGNDMPVTRVSWEDVQMFMEKLNNITGKKFRLPTEAEWEYAARGGENRSGYSDDDCLSMVGFRFQVKKNSPNELGLYDMMDNILQWCSDWYGNYGNSPLASPQGPSYGLNRVIRGGPRWYLSEDFNGYVWSRLGGDPEIAYKYVGFRLCLSE